MGEQGLGGLTARSSWKIRQNGGWEARRLDLAGLFTLPAPPPSNITAGRPRRLFCFGSLVVLDVVFRYLSLCLLYINTKIGKNRCLMLD